MASRGTARVGSFLYSRLQVQPWSPPAALLPAPAPGLTQSPRAPAAEPTSPASGEPLAGLLTSLRGREITLTVEWRMITGKLIQADPILLVNRQGEVTAVAPGSVSAITF